MALTPLQSNILELLAGLRRARGESYVAGGVALNALLKSPRRSRDIALFHDTEEALADTWPHAMLDRAREIAAVLPAPTVGTCVVSAKGDLFRGSPDEAAAALVAQALHFHAGAIGGAWPEFKI